MFIFNCQILIESYKKSIPWPNSLGPLRQIMILHGFLDLGHPIFLFRFSFGAFLDVVFSPVTLIFRNTTFVTRISFTRERNVTISYSFENFSKIKSKIIQRSLRKKRVKCCLAPLWKMGQFENRSIRKPINPKMSHFEIDHFKSG